MDNVVSHQASPRRAPGNRLISRAHFAGDRWRAPDSMYLVRMRATARRRPLRLIARRRAQVTYPFRIP